ncbi:hypothetical protein SDC9_78977 [bioreactor metagenome]|uniref:Uncharacterized protein n=1 Tax=bioreactor metagenome TaxID=1076179 RepID=A0A644YUZ5_9ZZZZ
MNQLQVVVKFSGCMSPVRRSLFAGAIFVYIINKLIHRQHTAIQILAELFAIIFEQSNGLQTIEVSPGIPVIHHAIGTGNKAHPPETVDIPVRIYNFMFDFVIQSFGDDWIYLIKLFMEEIIYPTQERSQFS